MTFVDGIMFGIDDILTHDYPQMSQRRLATFSRLFYWECTWGRTETRACLLRGSGNEEGRQRMLSSEVNMGIIRAVPGSRTSPLNGRRYGLMVLRLNLSKAEPCIDVGHLLAWPVLCYSKQMRVAILPTRTDLKTMKVENKHCGRKSRTKACKKS
jgi:hypothetical protein